MTLEKTVSLTMSCSGDLGSMVCSPAAALEKKAGGLFIYARLLQEQLGAMEGAVDFGALSAKEQVATMAGTTVLLGMQGAGMSNALFLPCIRAIAW